MLQCWAHVDCDVTFSELVRVFALSLCCSHTFGWDLENFVAVSRPDPRSKLMRSRDSGEDGVQELSGMACSILTQMASFLASGRNTSKLAT